MSGQPYSLILHPFPVPLLRSGEASVPCPDWSGPGELTVYGDPLDRDPELVLSDVLDGYTTVELAERDYGVVIDRETLALGAEATTRLRNERMAVPLA